MPLGLDYFFFHVREIFNYNLFKNFLISFLFLFFLWDNSKHTNIRIIWVPEEEEKKKGYKKNSEEIIVENFPNMEKEIVDRVQTAQNVPYRINSRRNIPRHILIKLTKTKQKEKQQGRSNKEHTRETPYA